MSKISLIAQPFRKDLILNDCRPPNMLTAKDLIRSARNSNAAYKETMKQKGGSEKKTEKDQRLASVQKEITRLNLKKLFLEEAIKEYHG